MTTKDKIIFGAVVVVISLLAGWGISVFHFGSPPFGAVGNQLIENYNSYVRQNGGINTNDPVTIGNTLTATTLTVTGTMTQTGAVTNNGITTTYVRQAFVSGTSTPCSIQSPAATSTVQSFSMNITTATSSAIAWSLGTSTTAFATSSSMIKNSSVAASNFATITWDPGANNGVISPSNWVLIGPDNVTVNTTGAFNSIVIAGSCQAVFQSEN